MPFKDPEKQKQYRRSWLSTNADKVRAYKRDSAERTYKKDPEKFKKKSRARRCADPEKAKKIAAKSERKRWGKRKGYNKQWRKNNEKRVKQWRSARYLYHRDDELKKNAQYCKKNAKRINANSARRYAKNPQFFRDKVRQWQRVNPEKYRLILKVCTARRKNVRGQVTPEQLQARIDYYGGLCAYCREPFKHIDHVIAIARGGTAWPANLRPACKRCNLKKGAKSWRVWQEELLTIITAT